MDYKNEEQTLMAELVFLVFIVDRFQRGLPSLVECIFESVMLIIVVEDWAMRLHLADSCNFPSG